MTVSGARGLPVSLSGFLENQLLQRQIGNSATETGVLTLKLLQTPGLVNLQAAIPPDANDSNSVPIFRYAGIPGQSSGLAPEKPLLHGGD